MSSSYKNLPRGESDQYVCEFESKFEQNLE
jgi:hypothetical protein